MHSINQEEIKHKLEDYPILKVMDYYILTSMVNLNNNIRRILNYHLKTYQEFKKHKSDTFENLVYSLVSFYSRGNIYKNVKFSNYQTDIVYEDDKYIYSIECKAIDLYDDYKRNIDKPTIMQNLSQILDEAITQGSRFFDYVNNGFEFRSDSGNVIFDKTKNKTVIFVSLESPLVEHINSIYPFINLSFSDFAAILQVSKIIKHYYVKKELWSIMIQKKH